MKVNHWTVLSVESEDGYAPELRDFAVFAGKNAEKKATQLFKRWVANLEGIDLRKMDMADESTLDEAVMSMEYEGREDFRGVRVYLQNTSVTVRV